MLGSEMATMLAVQVEITNLTKRSYQLDTEKITLVSIAGDRVRPLAEKDHAFPVHALTNQAVAPGAKVKGYLYYQLGVYILGRAGPWLKRRVKNVKGLKAPF